MIKGVIILLVETRFIIIKKSNTKFRSVASCCSVLRYSLDGNILSNYLHPASIYSEPKRVVVRHVVQIKVIIIIVTVKKIIFEFDDWSEFTT